MKKAIFIGKIPLISNGTTFENGVEYEVNDKLLGIFKGSFKLVEIPKPKTKRTRVSKSDKE